VRRHYENNTGVLICPLVKTNCGAGTFRIEWTVNSVGL